MAMDFKDTRIEESAAPVVAGLASSARPANWYAAYTRSRHEKMVSRQLEERSIACFLPLYSSVRRWKDRRKTLEVPLFPGYVFVHISLEDRIRVLGTPGVARFVSVNGRPAEVPNCDIESLQRGVTNGIHAEPHPYLKVGQKVRIKRGPLAGAEGILIRKKDKLRVVLSVHLIMRSVAAEVEVGDLE
jgi:transcription termination/antitermination protein NusG